MTSQGHQQSRTLYTKKVAHTHTIILWLCGLCPGQVVISRKRCYAEMFNNCSPFMAQIPKNQLWT